MFQLFDLKSNRRIPLAGVYKTIGRVTDCDICFPSDTKMSRHHAKLQWDGHNWFIQDNDSKNGTFVNGKPIKRTILASGDLIEVGLTELRYLPLETGSSLKTTPSDTLPIPILQEPSDDSAGEFDGDDFDVPTQSNIRKKD